MTFFRTVKYTHKLVLGRKNSILKFNPFTAEGFPIDEQNCLALDRVKSIGVMNLSDIHFLNLVFTSYCPQNAKNAFTRRQTKFQNFP